jgi:hypothetical protein
MDLDRRAQQITDEVGCKWLPPPFVVNYGCGHYGSRNQRYTVLGLRVYTKELWVSVSNIRP